MPQAAASPFNRIEYAATLPRMGRPEAAPDGGFFVLSRPIPGTDLRDGVGPWPYTWISGAGDIDAMHQAFPHLVTLTVVTQPGYVPDRGTAPFKHHRVFDPARPVPALSPRARQRLARCERQASFTIVRGERERMEIAGVYASLKRRRGLEGGFFDFAPDHFAALAKMREAMFFKVSRGAETGAMACGVRFGDILQMLHMPNSEAGLKWNASYLMMHGLQQLARAEGVRVMFGGLPRGASAGLDVFKARWSNGLLPVHMLRIVNDRRRYAGLCADLAVRDDYFPAYRIAS